MPATGEPVPERHADEKEEVHMNQPEQDDLDQQIAMNEAWPDSSNWRQPGRGAQNR